jgi:GNAT superfamily N-acetyltransferase
MKQPANVVSVQSTCAVRPAQPCDCEAMADLAGQLGYECTGEEVRKRLRDMQDSNQYAVFVAELPERQIAGWIGASLFRSIETASCVEINGLVVDNGIRSRGIGKILLSAVEEWARSIGFDVISVHSNVTRDRAHRFYLNNGYAQVKTQKEFRKSL